MLELLAHSAVADTVAIPAMADSLVTVVDTALAVMAAETADMAPVDTADTALVDTVDTALVDTALVDTAPVVTAVMADTAMVLAMD